MSHPLLTVTPITTIAPPSLEGVVLEEQFVRRAMEWIYMRMGARPKTLDQLIEECGPYTLESSEGKLASRIAKRLKERYDHKLAGDSYSTIANFISTNSPVASKPLHYDITNDFNWNAGDFGDGGSCFFSGLSSRAAIRQVMMENGGHAVRFYRTAFPHDGMGRAWIMPHTYGPVIFNAYGPELAMVKKHIKTILNDDKYKFIDLSPLHNEGRYDGPLYINKSKGILVHDGNLRSATLELDLRINTKRVSMALCRHCGENHERRGMAAYNGGWLCADCLNNHYVRDYPTNELVLRKDMVHIPITLPYGRDLGWVTPAFRDTMFQCPCCNHYQLPRDETFRVIVSGMPVHVCYFCYHQKKYMLRDRYGRFTSTTSTISTSSSTNSFR